MEGVVSVWRGQAFVLESGCSELGCILQNLEMKSATVYDTDLKILTD